jgi:hypothetical protein
MVLYYIIFIFRLYHSADTWAAVCIAIMTCGTMFPMSAYTGKILLQVRETTVRFLYGHISCNCVILSTNKRGQINLCYLVIGLIKLFWDFIHVERQ